MKLVGIFIICTTFLTQSIFSMELSQTNYFGTAAGDAKKQIFFALLNMDNTNRFMGFKEFLKCRRVCKEWLQNIDTIYKNILQQEQLMVDEYYKERGDCVSEYYCSDAELSHYSVTKDQYNEWCMQKEKQPEAVKHNLLIWMHHSLKVCRAYPKLEDGDYHPSLITPATLTGSIAIVELLIAMKIDVNRGDPLQAAISKRQTTIAKKLIEAGAKLGYTTKLNYNLQARYCTYAALNHAKDTNNQELVAFIEEFQKKSKKRASKTNEIVTNNKKQK